MTRPRHWHLHVKTTDGKFYVRKPAFTSLRKAKKAAIKYGKARPDWLAEVRVYRVEAGEACEHCESGPTEVAS
jgi:hypothetical protein